MEVEVRNRVGEGPLNEGCGAEWAQKVPWRIPFIFAVSVPSCTQKWFLYVRSSDKAPRAIFVAPQEMMPLVSIGVFEQLARVFIFCARFVFFLAFSFPPGLLTLRSRTPDHYAVL